MAAATAWSRFIDPNCNTSRYPLYLSSDIRERREPDRRYYSFRYNHKPGRKANSTRKTVFNAPTDPASPTAPALRISDNGRADHHGSNSEDEEQYAYSGAALRQEDTEPFVLIHDPEKNAFTLHALATCYAFNLTDGSSYGDAIHDGDPDPQESKTSNIAQTNGFTHGSSISSATTSPAHSIEADPLADPFSADEGGLSPDADNPFDWRHYLHGVPGSADDKPGGNASRPASVAGTPVSRISSPLARAGAATHSSPSFAPTGPPPRSVPSTTDSRAQPPAKRQKIEPSILRRPKTHDRARNISSVTAPSQIFRPVTPSINVENATPDTNPTLPFSHHKRPHSYSAPQAPSDPNELIIEGEDDRPARQNFGSSTPAFATPPTGRPMSLREAASRGASPLMPPRSKPGKRFGGPGFATERQGLGIRGLNGEAEVIDFGDGVSRRSNGDVETDLELGSPAYAPRSPDLRALEGLKEKTGDGSVKSGGASPRSVAKSLEAGYVEEEKDESHKREEESRKERENSIDALEHALHDALGGEAEETHEEADALQEAQDEEGNLGDALAAALAAAGDEGGEEESEEE